MKKSETALTKEQWALVERHMGLVKRALAKRVNCGLDQDDAYQIGCLGLMHAATRYDGTRGVKFTTFAIRCITNQLGIAMRKEKKHQCALSLDASLGDGGEQSHIDELPDPGPSVVEVVESADDLQFVRMLVMQTAGPHADAVRAYLLGSDPQSRIAKAYGISQQELSRSVKQAVRAIGKRMRREGWRP